MKKSIFLVFFITFLSIHPAFSEGIDKNVDEYAGKRCNTPKKGSGVVVGYFSGMRESPFLYNDSYVAVDRYRCFSTMRECRGWLYTMQSLYNAPPPRHVSCKKF